MGTPWGILVDRKDRNDSEKGKLSHGNIEQFRTWKPSHS
jgi:hypothetical protein